MRWRRGDGSRWRSCRRRWRRSDAAFPHLVRALIDGVYSGALRLTGSRADAEDVAQEAFLRAYRALGTYEAARIRELRLREWVWAIAANLCRNRARSARRHPEEALPAEAPVPDTAPGPEAEAVAAVGIRFWRNSWPDSPGRGARRWCCAM